MTAPNASAPHGWRWTGLAAVVGFLASFVLSTGLHLSRGLFLAAYAAVAAVFVGIYVASQGVDVRTQIGRRWTVGVVGGVVFGILLVRQVFMQPASTRSEGLTLVGELAWYGVVYGIVDALLLSVIPVLSLYGMRLPSDLRQTAGRLRWGFVALLGSAFVTAAYHAGFAEFRGPELLQPVIGNLVVSLAYLLTGNPLAAIISHVLMHVAAVLHGMGTTMQLPPHYR
jgi:CAAX prenyl protease-like protein